MKKKLVFIILFVLAFVGVFTSCKTIDTVNSDEKEKTKTLEDFKHAKVSVMSGSVQDLLLDEILPDCERCYYTTNPDCGLALEARKVDAALVNEASGVVMQASYRDITHLEQVFNPHEVGAVFPKTSEGDRLREEFDSFIEKMRATGELDAMYKKWVCADYEKNEPPVLPENDGIRKPLSIGTDASDIPFDFYQDNKLSGFDIELMGRFCEDNNYYPIIYDCNFDSLIVGIATGNYDMGAAIFAYNDERKKMINFSVPVCSIGSMIYYIDDDALETGVAESLQERLKATFVVEDRWKLLLNGLLATLEITVISAILGTILGFLICKGKLSKVKWLNIFLSAFIKIFQGTPMVVVLMVFYYIIFGHSSISNILIASFAFACNFSAYSANIFYQGIMAIDNGQREAALALGFTERESFYRFVFPQAIGHFITVYIGECISLLKSTSIVGYISIQDLTKMGDLIRSRTFDPFVPLICVAICYFLLSYSVTKLLNYLAKKINPDKIARRPKGVKVDD